MLAHRSKSDKVLSAKQVRKDPYEVLGVLRNSTDQEIKFAYRKMALNKLGVPIKTTVSATILEEALHGVVTTVPLQLGKPLFKKVEKQCAHFYSITITEEEVRGGFVCRVCSSDKSKFKLLYFDQEESGGLSLALQEDSTKIGKVTSAGMFFLGFPVFRLAQTVNSMAAAKDRDTAFFKKLDGFQPCELTELKAGTHVFAVYGDNFFKSASYTIEALCAATFTEEKEKLRAVESQILTKRVLSQFSEMTSRCAQEMQAIDELLKHRNEIQASYTAASPLKRSTSRSKSKGTFKEAKEDGPERDNKRASKDNGTSKEAKEDGQEGDNKCDSKEAKEDSGPKDKKPMQRDMSKKSRWYNVRLKLDKRKPC